ncbi:MAG: glycerophosphodiester phosphodiesterase [Syntrophomonadaceae bacterium]|nr:glycerophosphodiester phosphodiesterase [Syntrophomonadaceae bacterium]
MWVGAHRGASAQAPENTLAAFSLAMDRGVAWMECDVQLTRDGVPVVIHDETLERTTNGRGEVAGWWWRDLCRLDAGSWKGPEWRGERVPALEELLCLVRGRCLLNVELKTAVVAYPGIEEKVAALVRHHGLAEQVLVSSFSVATLLRMQECAPELPLAFLWDQAPGNVFSALPSALRLTALHPSATAVTEELVLRARQRGLLVHTWVVDCPQQAREMERAGVHGLLTNLPPTMDALLALHARWRGRTASEAL